MHTGLYVYKQQLGFVNAVHKRSNNQIFGYRDEIASLIIKRMGGN